MNEMTDPEETMTWSQIALISKPKILGLQFIAFYYLKIFIAIRIIMRQRPKLGK